ncbi:MAG: hypothetical protein IJY83_07995 [Oscillospiraceae bacterium]|jgi:hypothetical protein|nr:hypothetical protein [Oscillospiraceae bacterium]
MNTSGNVSKTFNSRQILMVFTGNVPSSTAEIYRQINKLIKSGEITRIERNSYALGKIDVSPYSFDYSEIAESVSSMIETNYTDVKFTIFETRQFNEFMNLQIGKNTIIVSVEAGLENYIFQELSKTYPGKVLLKPDIKTLWTYLQEDTIIIEKLPTEAPVSAVKKWMTVPEKFLVDLIADKILKTLITQSQLEYIFEGYLNHYQIDIKKMLRYARRRTCEDALKLQIKKYKEK